MEVSLSEQLPALTPIKIRKQKAKEVFKLLARLSSYNERKIKTKDKPNVIRRPAGDNWF
jgi:hypothetical protein